MLWKLNYKTYWTRITIFTVSKQVKLNRATVNRQIVVRYFIRKNMLIFFVYESEVEERFFYIYYEHLVKTLISRVYRLFRMITLQDVR